VGHGSSLARSLPPAIRGTPGSMCGPSARRISPGGGVLAGRTGTRVRPQDGESPTARAPAASAPASARIAPATPGTAAATAPDNAAPVSKHRPSTA
jgi:hypothetical protein